MADAEAGTVAPRAPPAPTTQRTTRIDRVDTSLLHKDLWVLKVPSVFADLVASAPLGVALGTLRETELSAQAAPSAQQAGPSKRRKTRLSFVIDPSAIASLPPEVRARTPSRYSVALEPEAQYLAARAMPGTGFVLLGAAEASGTIVPDETDPAYRAHLAHRRARDRAAASGRHGGKLRDETDDMLSRMDGGGTAAAAVAASVPAAPRGGAGGGGGVSAPLQQRSGGGGSSVLGLFEVRAYWSLKDLAAATGKKEVCAGVRVWAPHWPECHHCLSPLQSEVRYELSDSCEYLRAGAHRGTYRLRAAFRSSSSAPRDPGDDGGD